MSPDVTSCLLVVPASEMGRHNLLVGPKGEPSVADAAPHLHQAAGQQDQLLGDDVGPLHAAVGGVVDLAQVILHLAADSCQLLARFTLDVAPTNEE